MNTPTELRAICGHDSRSVDGCVHCEAADALERKDSLLEMSLPTMHNLHDKVRELTAQRDALQAKLDALQRQEPVALEDEMLDAAISWCDSNGINVLEPEQLSSLVNSLYITVCDAAPKALEPTQSATEKYCGNCPLRPLVDAAHGITKGTP